LLRKRQGAIRWVVTFPAQHSVQQSLCGLLAARRRVAEAEGYAEGAISSAFAPFPASGYEESVLPGESGVSGIDSGGVEGGGKLTFIRATIRFATGA